MLDEITITKELDWLKPYMITVLSVEPRMHRVKSIRLMKPHRDKTMHHYAAARYNKNEATITLMAGEWGYNVKNNMRCNLKFNPYSKVELLCNLAHELSHLKMFWDGDNDGKIHTPRRQMLESVFVIHFMELLEVDGYHSEEAEFEDIKRVQRKGKKQP